jgi:predicted HTH transcriptional regulator
MGDHDAPESAIRMDRKKRSGSAGTGDQNGPEPPLWNAVSRAVIFAAGEWIRPQDFQLRDVDMASAPTGGQSQGASGVDRLDLTPRQREALELAARHGSVRRADLVSRFRISGEAARRDLAGLVRAGLLQRHRLRGISRYVLADGPAGPGGGASGD